MSKYSLDSSICEGKTGKQQTTKQLLITISYSLIAPCLKLQSFLFDKTDKSELACEWVESHIKSYTRLLAAQLTHKAEASVLLVLTVKLR